MESQILDWLANVVGALVVLIPAAIWYVRKQVESQLKKTADRYNYQLRNAETVFQRRVAATEELGAYIEGLRPRVHSLADDWSDVLEDIAHRFDEIEQWVSDFVKRHNAVLGQKEINTLHAASILSGEGKIRTQLFEAEAPPDIDSDAREVADVVHSALSEAYSEIKKSVYDHSSIETGPSFFSEFLPSMRVRLSKGSSGRE